MEEIALILGNGSIDIATELEALPRRDLAALDADPRWLWASIVKVAHPKIAYASANAYAHAPTDDSFWLRATKIGPRVGNDATEPVATWIVLTNPAEGREAEFNEWFDNRHIHDSLAVPGFVSGQRFRLDAARFGETPRWQYLVLYEISLDGAQASRDEAFRRAGTPQMPNPGNLAPGSATLLVGPIP
jgi:hypothetical protein